MSSYRVKLYRSKQEVAEIDVDDADSEDEAVSKAYAEGEQNEKHWSAGEWAYDTMMTEVEKTDA